MTADRCQEDTLLVAFYTPQHRCDISGVSN